MVAEAILLALVIYRLNVSAPKVLDITEAQRGVQKVLSDPVDGYGIASVTNVFCNGGRQPIVEKGSTFNCDVSVDRSHRNATVVFQDEAGTYAVDRPQ